MIQGGSVIIADFEDMWGNVTNIGLGEHAVRTHAPPMFFDKRGSVLRYVDFESPTFDFATMVTGLATALRSTDISLTGDFSLKMYCPNNTDKAYIYVKTHDFHEKTAASQMVFSAADTNGLLQLYLVYFSGTKYYCFKVEYNFGLGFLDIYTDDQLPFHRVATLNIDFETEIISTLKLTGDFLNNRYKSVQIFGKEYDLSSFSAETIVSGISKRFYTSIVYQSLSGISTMYIDNIILTENE